MLLTSAGGRADPPTSPGPDNDIARSQQGFAIAPVTLNLKGKTGAQITQVGLGSYFVNAIGDCNGCHTSGGPPNFNYLASHNPYFLLQMPTMTDPTQYLAGGSDFGPALPFNVGSGLAYGSYVGPDMITRNLTPDKNGLPEGGMTLAQFTQILQTGVDMDHIHPTCTSPTGGTGGTPTPTNCIPPPVNGALLQIMPWPVFHNMTVDDIQNVYEYLSTIPCIDNSTGTPPAGAPNELRNDCGIGPPPPPKVHGPDFVRQDPTEATRRAR
jgi:hypothetical protein